jgi:hypothetical protein
MLFDYHNAKGKNLIDETMGFNAPQENEIKL